MNLPNGVTTRIVLVRHGEPVESAKGKCYGKLDVGLSDQGKRQIEETAEFLESFELGAVYASPRIRAIESAKIIARQQNLLVEICENFAEIDFGDFEGLSYEKVEQQFPEIYQKWMNAPTTVEFPNGESFAIMQRRVLQAASELRARHDRRETFAIVSHGGVNRTILADVLSIADKNIFRLAQDHAAVNVIDFYEDFPVVRAMNWTAENKWR